MDDEERYEFDRVLTEEDQEFIKQLPIEYYKNITNGFWMEDPYVNPNASFVNLVNIPEKHTGYNGSFIWEGIYSENLDKVKFTKPGKHDKFLHNLVSGVQTSVNMHISQEYIDPDSDHFYRNRQIFYDRVGKHPERVQSLFYLYVYLLDVINGIGSILPNYTYYPGNITENEIMQEKITRLVDYIGDTDNSKLVENDVIGDISFQEFIDNINPTFKNITTLLD
jgi:hypothetical protein